ncbi:RNA-directed DNA polymerase, eukaryota, reverse transcriptase zinc-binding domain protein [Tanacetum coccineum]
MHVLKLAKYACLKLAKHVCKRNIIGCFVSDTWRNAPADMSNGMRNMTGKLKFLKSKIRKWIKDNRCNRKVTFDKLKEELRLVDEAIDKGVGTEEDVNKRVEVLNSLRYIDQMHAMDLAQKAKIKWSIEGEQRDELEREVKIEEIKTAVWNCGTDKSPGPDGFTFDFYRQFWSSIDKDVYAAVNHFFINGDIPAGCNLSFIALIPKVPDANLVKDFRPISLIGSIYKIIAKILTNRLINVLGDIVSEVQSAFVAGRQMLDDPFILNEVLHWCSKKKQKSLIFKVDFEKAYDSVRWDFLDDVLKKFGFDHGVNVEGSYVNQPAVKLGCQVLTSPFIYLGTKVGGTMSRVFSMAGGMEGCEKDSALQVENENFIHWRSTYIAEICVRFYFLYSICRYLEFHQGFFKSWNLSEVVFSMVMRLAVKRCHSLWTKVITAIHGVNGNVSSSGAKAGRSCWLAIVDEVRALHKKGVYVFDFMNLKLGNGEMVKFWLDRWYEGGILKDLFPRMFALENMKEITVSSKLNGDNLADSFRRSPRGELNRLNLSSGEFSVASIRRLIDEMRFPNIGDTTRWVKYVPIKVNILAWKIRCDVLPTRMNLSRRGIDIQAISCPICDYGVESSEHLFFRCNMIRDIGKQIVRWWNINYEEVSSYEEWKTWLTSCRKAPKLKQVFEGVWYTLW